MRKVEGGGGGVALRGGSREAHVTFATGNDEASLICHGTTQNMVSDATGITGCNRRHISPL